MTNIILNKNKKVSVLFLDDEPFISGLLADNLRLIGWDVTFVDNIFDLFKELKTQLFDILIYDIMIPIPEDIDKRMSEYVNFSKNEILEMDEGRNAGVVLAKKTWWEINSDLPILFLSARQPDTISQLPKEDYIFAHIRKPADINELDKKLKEMLRIDSL